MKISESTLLERVTPCVEQVRTGTADERVEATGRVLAAVVPALPADVRATPILLAHWSQSFAINEWWQELWSRLGVVTVGDLARVGRPLAQAKGVGRAKLLSLIEDLIRASGSKRKGGASATDSDRLAAMVRSLKDIDAGPPSPHAHHVASLMRALVASLPPVMQAWEVASVPWTNQWCYTTRAWSEIGVVTVADLQRAAPELAHARGIGRGKVLTIARELVLLCPELHARLVREFPESAVMLGSHRSKHASNTGTLVDTIDRLAERLDARERDVLRRRIGWRYAHRPERLRVLADHHQVTQERIRQLEYQLRQRLGRLLQILQVPATLQSILHKQCAPVPLKDAIACRPELFLGMMEVWRPLGSLLEAEGGPYLVEDLRHPGRVIVSLTPASSRAVSFAARLAPATAAVDQEIALRCSRTPPSAC